jgi:hydrogenase maturation factor
MCLPEAGRVICVEGDEAVVELRGVRVQVPLVVLTFGGEGVGVGDWLLLHTGLAVARITAAEAAEVNAIRQGDVHE